MNMSIAARFGSHLNSANKAYRCPASEHDYVSRTQLRSAARS
jgi:hypothetical protein